MPSASITICNRLGLHARASAKLTQLAAQFSGQVWISKGEQRVNAKSILGVMMLAAGYGSQVVLETEGENEAEAQQALDGLCALFANQFGEGQ
jgi:phosphocarrier protein HPr